MQALRTQFRRHMPIAEKWAYFDHAAVAPLPGPTAEAVAGWARQAATEGDTIWPTWSRRLESIRQAAGDLLAADPAEIAFVPSTTAGINIVAEGFPWQPGDNVVTLANEFPSNLYPWLHLAGRGVQVRRVPVDGGIPSLDRLIGACDHRTRLVAVSWVGYASGWRWDLPQLAEAVHRTQALLFVDAIQGLGVYPLNVSQTRIDFLAADGHKWLLGPEGAGVFYVRREHLDLLRPTGVGWNSVAQRYDFDRIELTFRDSAARYEGGSMNMPGLHGLGASLDLLRDLGVGPNHSPVAEAILDFTATAAEALQRAGARILSPRVPGHQSGILVMDLPGVAPEAARQRCLDAGVVVSCRGGGIRLSPHAYNDASDLERLLDAISAGNGTS